MKVIIAVSFSLVSAAAVADTLMNCSLPNQIQVQISTPVNSQVQVVQTSQNLTVSKRSGTFEAAVNGLYAAVEVLDANGKVILNLGSEENGSGLDGYYVDTQGNQSPANCEFLNN